MSVLRVQPLLELGMWSNYRIHAALTKYAPDFIEFTGEYKEADDIDHSWGMPPKWEIDTTCDTYLFHSTPKGDFYRKIYWDEIEWLKELTTDVLNKPKIILFEPHLHFGDTWITEYPRWVKDTDVLQIFVMSGYAPKHPNLISYPQPASGRWVDEELFHVKEGIIRDEDRVILSHDHIYEKIHHFSNPLHILGINPNVLKPAKEGDTCCIIKQQEPEKLADLYNSLGHAVNFQPYGFESWLVEARFCGVKSYYPDVSVYRTLFGDENVGFFDLDDVEGTLKLENDMTEADIAYSRVKWGARNRVPLFWEEVKRRIKP